jgi:SAM-dependent methyltransferase
VKFEWINAAEAAEISADQVVVFGAGRGTEELVEFLGVHAPGKEITAVVDNDPSLWDKTLLGIPVLPPERLAAIPFDQIVVTSISGRETIALQLEQMGLKYPDDFILIGRYPAAYSKNFDLIVKELGWPLPIPHARCLHVGPGGFLGLEVMLYSFGAHHISSVDKYGFGVTYPDITPRLGEYGQIGRLLETYSKVPFHTEDTANRFHSLFLRNGGKVCLDQDLIAYDCPVDLIDMPFPDRSFDFVFSFAVLEHVTDPEAAVREIARVLIPGGFAFQTIITRDHRSFSKVHGFTPFSFRCCSSREWNRICERKFYQNRILPVEWKRLFEKCDLQVRRCSIHEEISLDEDTIGTFHPDFRRFSAEELGDIDCTIVARKSRP